MRSTLAVVAAAFILTANPTAASKVDGLWDAVITSGGGQNAPTFEIPFRFEIATSGSTVQGFFFEGDRKIGSTSGTFVDGNLTLEYDFLNTTLELTVDDRGAGGP